MSCHLFVTYCPVPKTITKATRSAAQQKARSLSDEALFTVAENFLAGGDPESFSRDAAIAAIDAAIDLVLTEYPPPDCTFITPVPGHRFLISGGESWGASPTESYDSVTCLWWLQEEGDE